MNVALIRGRPAPGRTDEERLTQATYLGGSGLVDVAQALAIHPKTGDVYLAGYTDAEDLPGTTGGSQAALGGLADAFVARLPASLTALIQATYLGGSATEEAFALAINPATGDVYLAGWTSSTNLPGTVGGAQATFGGGGLLDAFVARLPASLMTLTQATYLGGSSLDTAQALAIHPTTGDVYVAGATASASFPGTAGGAQATPGGGGLLDAFVARLPASLTAVTQATYLGGSSLDIAQALAIHPTTGDVYVAGATASANFPGTAGGAQAAYGGGDEDVFVARLTANLAAPQPIPSRMPIVQLPNRRLIRWK